MIVAAAALATFLAGLLVILLWNLAFLRRRTAPPLDEAELPFVSVLVPARNEERNIESCVLSLLAQDYPRFEVRLLDDHSTDATPGLVHALADRDARLTVLQSAALPEGWTGKNFACHQLADGARGAWLLFTDADTVHAPHALRTAMGQAIATDADLFTQIPRQRMITFGERLVLPLLHFVSLTLLPVFFTHHSRSPRFAIGVGQYLLFRRSAYNRIGGHAAVRGAIVEDVWLARRIKVAGLRLRLHPAVDEVTCRMYRNWNEIWNGFSKNIFAGMNFSTPSLLAVLTLLFLLFVAPAPALIAALVFHAPPGVTVALGVAVLLTIGMRLLLAVRFRLGYVSCLLHPAGMLAVIAIGVNSWRLIRNGAGAPWKGRSYLPSTLASSDTDCP